VFEASAKSVGVDIADRLCPDRAVAANSFIH
jgi:hypothetical protein